VLGGCATQAALGRLPGVAARQQSTVRLGPIVTLFDHVPRAAASAMTSNGGLHVVAVDREGWVRHLQIQDEEIVVEERLGRLATSASGPTPPIDVVEHPLGTLRVLASDLSFRRAADQSAWEETAGNRCAAFLPTADRLLCAFVLDGTEVSAPRRTDVSGGLLLVVPVVWWTHETADKLVVAEETDAGWELRWVVDPNTTLDAGPDFLAGIDVDGTIHLVFAEGRGGGYFIASGGPGGAGALAGGPASHLRLAVVETGRRGGAPPNAGSVTDAPDRRWQPVGARPLQSNLLDALTGSAAVGNLGLRPVDRHFSLDSRTGTISVTVSVPTHVLTGDRASSLAPQDDSAWTVFRLCGDAWCGEPELAAADQLPDPSFRWHADEPLLVVDETGRDHLLLIATDPGFWVNSSRTVYLEREPTGDWSAPLELGASVAGSVCSVRLLAVDARGSVFAAWPDDAGRFVGRWLRR
jgi:hypothetical protein